MMSPGEISQLIDEHASRTDTAEDIAAALNAAAVETRITARVTTATLLDALEPDEFATVRTVLAAAAAQSPYADGVREAMAGQGVMFSDSRSLEFIEQLRGQLGDVVADKLRALGVVSAPVLSEPVTVEQVTTALEWSENVAWLAERYNAAAQLLDEGASRKEIKAALTGE